VRSMRLCVVSFKQCWQDAGGRWVSYGGFPAQMQTLRRLFDDMTLVIVRAAVRDGGMPLPDDALVVPLRSPVGVDLRRKISVMAHLGYYWREIGRAVRAADLVHAPVPGDIAYLGLLAAALRRKRLLALYNGSWTPNTQTTLMNRVTRMTMRLLARRGGVMLAVGDGERPPARGMSWLFATSLSQCELASGRPNLERGLSQPPRMVYAGRLSVEKGVPVLLGALARLRTAGGAPLPRLTLVGDGPQRPALEALVRDLQLVDLVTFAGQLDRTNLAAALAAADFCVHPSFTEGYCKAWLDAMAYGLPVLTSEVGAAHAVVGPDGARGWLVVPGDEEALAARLRAVLTEPMDWAALRRRCRAYAEARTLESWGEAMADACARRWELGRRNGRLVS